MEATAGVVFAHNGLVPIPIVRPEYATALAYAALGASLCGWTVTAHALHQLLHRLCVCTSNALVVSQLVTVQDIRVCSSTIACITVVLRDGGSTWLRRCQYRHKNNADLLRCIKIAD